MSQVYDFVGIGLGPFNLGLACLTEPIHDLDGVFLERKAAVNWHPGMLIEGTTLQVPFLADLVTLADPTSPFSFLAYLKAVGRLYPFYIRESFYPLRAEFQDYCRWAAARLGNLRFQREVSAVEFDREREAYAVRSLGPDGTAHVDYGRRIVLGTGTPPWIPDACRDLDAATVCHSSDYLSHRDALRATGSITVVGSGQSAAEIYRDLLADIEPGGYELNWVTRSPRFFPLEYTKLTLEMTSPDYVDYFHSLPPKAREQLNAEQKNLYKGINSELIDEIYDLLYTKRVEQGSVPTRLFTNCSVDKAAHDGEGLRLGLRQAEQGRDFELRTEALVLATGYRHQVPAFLNGVADRLRFDREGRLEARRDYSVDAAARGEVFVQNAELATHGFVTPDLGMAAYRNSWIIRAMCGREVYPIEQSIAFQAFAAPEGANR